MERLQRIEGVRVAAPDGAFYVLPDLSAFFGTDVHADDFGPIPDADTLCRCEKAPHRPDSNQDIHESQRQK